MTPFILHHFFLRERRKAKGNVVNVMETLYLHSLSSQTNSLLRMLQRDVLGGFLDPLTSISGDSFSHTNDLIPLDSEKAFNLLFWAA